MRAKILRDGVVLHVSPTLGPASIKTFQRGHIVNVVRLCEAEGVASAEIKLKDGQVGYIAADAPRLTFRSVVTIGDNTILYKDQSAREIAAELPEGTPLDLGQTYNTHSGALWVEAVTAEGVFGYVGRNVRVQEVSPNQPVRNPPPKGANLPIGGAQAKGVERLVLNAQSRAEYSRVRRWIVYGFLAAISMAVATIGETIESAVDYDFIVAASPVHQVCAVCSRPAITTRKYRDNYGFVGEFPFCIEHANVASFGPVGSFPEWKTRPSASGLAALECIFIVPPLAIVLFLLSDAKRMYRGERTILIARPRDRILRRSTKDRFLLPAQAFTVVSLLLTGGLLLLKTLSVATAYFQR